MSEYEKRIGSAVNLTIVWERERVFLKTQCFYFCLFRFMIMIFVYLKSFNFLNNAESSSICFASNWQIKCFRKKKYFYFLAWLFFVNLPFGTHCLTHHPNVCFISSVKLKAIYGKPRKFHRLQLYWLTPSFSICCIFFAFNTK